jgi:hypothetical protein
LHYATIKGDLGLVSLLLKRNAIVDTKDKRGKRPIDYAMEKSSSGEHFVQIVIYLKLKSLSEETKESGQTFGNCKKAWVDFLANLGIEEAMAELRSSQTEAVEQPVVAPAGLDPFASESPELTVPAHFIEKPKPEYLDSDNPW